MKTTLGGVFRLGVAGAFNTLAVAPAMWLTDLGLPEVAALYVLARLTVADADDLKMGEKT